MMSNRIGSRHLIVAGLLFLLPIFAMIILEYRLRYGAWVNPIPECVPHVMRPSVFLVVNMFRYSKSKGAYCSMDFDSICSRSPYLCPFNAYNSRRLLDGRE